MVLVFIDHADGQVDELSLQAVALARELTGGGPLEALLAGPGAREAAAQLGAHGVATAHVAEDDRLSAFAPAAWAQKDRAVASAGRRSASRRRACPAWPASRGSRCGS